MVDFGAIIGDSANWTKKVLFQPFNFKKWLILAFIAVMAGSMSNGCNYNSGGDNHYESQQQQQQGGGACGGAGGGGTCAAPSAPGQDMSVFWAIFGSAMLFIVALVLLFVWLGSRFAFVFIEDIVKNDASVKKPFADNADVGNSYFKFNIVFMGIFLITLLSFIGTGIAIYTQAMYLAFIPLVLVFIVVAAAAGVFSVMLIDIVLPIMFKDRIKTLAGIGRAWALVKANKGNFTVYILIKIGLGIGAGIAYTIVAIGAAIVLLIPIALVAAALYFLSKVLPAAAVLPYWIITGVILTPICLFIFYCLMALNLPFAVFFRSMSIKFLEKLDPQYALIPSEKQVAAQQ
ncbi:MAG: hypothetical protein PHE80_07470 [Candidatus Omnitrophica bacterium]|nr:hypothetical protein [Candidatus Omnitrophota bacterium]